MRGLLEEIDLLLIDRYRFRALADSFRTNPRTLPPIPPGAAVFADLGFTVIAISAEWVVIITIRRAHSTWTT